MKSPKFLTLVGNIGSGKSSALKLLGDKLSLPTIDADNLFQTTDPFAKDYLKNVGRWAFTNELWLTVQRSQIIYGKTLNNGVKISKNLSLVDSGPLMSWVYGYGHKQAGTMTAKEWQFFSELYDHFSKNFMEETIVLQLDYSIETLLKRIKKRNRPMEEKYYTAVYLDQINKGLRALNRKLRKNNISVLRITEDMVPEFLADTNGKEELVGLVKKFLKENS